MACPESEPDCGVLGYCNAEGSCGLPFPVCPPPAECDQDEDCPQIESCMQCPDGSASCPEAHCVAGKCTTVFPECPAECRSPEDCPQLGMPCQECPDGTIVCPGFDCIDGECVEKYAGCGYDPCAGKACGAACTVCDPADPDCVETAVLKFCDSAGVCRPSYPECPTPPSCTTDDDCPGVGACPRCPGDQCAELRCIGGRCVFTCDLCYLPKDPGQCDAAISRFWFDATTGKCEPFIYGGCEGNANNFETAQACVEACADPGVAPCQAIACEMGTSCVYLGTTPVCAAPCGQGDECPIGFGCVCAGSCPGCEDCRRVCAPSP